MRCKKVCLALMLASGLLLTSCALLPEEEAIRTAPVIRAYTPAEYHILQVRRGDLTRSAKVTCQYVPVKTASLSFALSDEFVDKVFVQAGDAVQEGQLLAQLELGDLEKRIEEAGNAAAELEVRHTYQQKLYELALRRHEAASQDWTEEEKAEALEALREDYAQRSQELLDALELQNLTLKELEEELALRQIRAPFSGTVSRVSKYEDGDVSSLASSVLTLVDSTMSLFRANTEHWEQFHAGDEYEIVVRNQPYRAVVTDETALGLEKAERVPGKRADVYFVLSEPAFELEEGNIGTLVLVLSEHHEVVYVPSNALSATDGNPIVYYQREDGMKAIKTVETGVTVGNYTEILSGLEEGEEIIVDEGCAY